jgi:hypothetical protein
VELDTQLRTAAALGRDEATISSLEAQVSEQKAKVAQLTAAQTGAQARDEKIKRLIAQSGEREALELTRIRADTSLSPQAKAVQLAKARIDFAKELSAQIAQLKIDAVNAGATFEPAAKEAVVREIKAPSYEQLSARIEQLALEQLGDTPSTAAVAAPDGAPKPSDKRDRGSARFLSFPSLFPPANK